MRRMRERELPAVETSFSTMTRSLQEMATAALELRARLLTEGKDPLMGVFHITQEERSWLQLEPASSVVLERTQLTGEPLRLCGLLVKLV